MDKDDINGQFVLWAAIYGDWGFNWWCKRLHSSIILNIYR